MCHVDTGDRVDFDFTVNDGCVLCCTVTKRVCEFMTNSLLSLLVAGWTWTTPSSSRQIRTAWSCSNRYPALIEWVMTALSVTFAVASHLTHCAPWLQLQTLTLVLALALTLTLALALVLVLTLTLNHSCNCKTRRDNCAKPSKDRSPRCRVV